jgi:arabinofuranosyltransferase
MDPSTPRLDRRLCGLLWLFCLWIVLRNAWLCEDAFITFRVVDNAVHGLGLRWNPLERVQVYTHPLWTLALLPLQLVSRDIFASAFALSLGCTAATLGLLFLRGMKTPAQAVVLAAIVVSSKALMDYSTSGLENPLSHLLLVLFFLAYLRRDEPRTFARMILWMALAMVTRTDLVWFFLPAVVHTAWSKGYWRFRHARLWAGLLVGVAWAVFAVLYYGFPFPSSAYAKLAVHIPAGAQLVQGFCYLTNSLAWDPVTLFAITGLTLLGLARFRTDRKGALLALGVVLYLAYVVRIGGDYMSGRFLTAPLVVSLVGLSRIELRMPELGVALALTILLGFCSPRPPALVDDDYKGLGKSPHGVDDEKGYRFADTSLLRQNRHTHLSDASGWVADGRKAKQDHVRVAVVHNVGFFGFYAGPDVHIIDPYGLGDALMGHLPYVNDSSSWDPGHYDRKVPDGYAEAALDGGRIADGKVDAYWRKIELVTRGPIFDGRRLALVLRFTLGLEPSPPP